MYDKIVNLIPGYNGNRGRRGYDVCLSVCLFVCPSITQKRMTSKSSITLGAGNMTSRYPRSDVVLEFQGHSLVLRLGHNNTAWVRTLRVPSSSINVHATGPVIFEEQHPALINTHAIRLLIIPRRRQ